MDIGSGTGWLLGKTAPLFKKVIGVEPSEAATKSIRLSVFKFHKHRIHKQRYDRCN